MKAAKKKRAGLRPITRFEVFKRDRFTCQYCGRTPPAVLLEIDHVQPVAKGGDNAAHNLVTACWDCNRGKGARQLNAVPPTLVEDAERRKEIAAQVAAYNKLLTDLRKQEDDAIRRIGIYYFNQFKDEPNTFVFGFGRVPSIRRFLKSLPEACIIESIDAAFTNLGRPYTDREEDRVFRYFCGVCWRKIREQS